MILITVFYWS